MKRRLLKKWFVRIFFRFWVERDPGQSWRIMVKPPWKGGVYIYPKRYVSKPIATWRMAELRKDGAYLYDIFTKWN